MQLRAPAVYEWVARLWNCKKSKIQQMHKKISLPPPGTLPSSWMRLLLPLLAEYLEYYHLNAVAYRNGRSSFVWQNRGLAFDVQVRLGLGSVSVSGLILLQIKIDFSKFDIHL